MLNLSTTSSSPRSTISWGNFSYLVTWGPLAIPSVFKTSSRTLNWRRTIKAELWKEFLGKSSMRKKLKGSIKTRIIFLSRSFSIRNKEFLSSFQAMDTLNLKCCKNSFWFQSLKNGCRKIFLRTNNLQESLSFSKKFASWLKNLTFTLTILSSNWTMRDSSRFLKLSHSHCRKNNSIGSWMIIASSKISSYLRVIVTLKSGLERSWKSSNKRFLRISSWTLAKVQQKMTRKMPKRRVVRRTINQTNWFRKMSWYRNFITKV